MEVADDRDLPGAAHSEDGRIGWRMRARHRLHEPQTPADRASDEQIVLLIARAADLLAGDQDPRSSVGGGAAGAGSGRPAGRPLPQANPEVSDGVPRFEPTRCFAACSV